nr:integrase, catalytic region, zinc finger, CCHC-type, peptidase aspartic, catalytic [Tanacetum cinerariifolium]
MEIERLLKAVVSQDIMSVVQNNSVVDTSHLQTELEHTKERFENCIIKNENDYAKLWNDCHFYSIPTQESKVVKNDKVIALGMFRINPFKTSREEKHVPNTVSASNMTKPITVSQPPIFTKKDVNSDSNGLSSTEVDNTKTRRPQPRRNTKNDRVPSESKSSCNKHKGVEVEEHHRNLLFFKNKKHMSSVCCSKHMTGNLKLLVNFVWKFLGTIRFGNDHVAAILGFGQFCDSDLKVALRRNACFVRNLEGVDLLSGNRTTNLYTINLHDMASASPICLMARASLPSHGYGINLFKKVSDQKDNTQNLSANTKFAKQPIVENLPKIGKTNAWSKPVTLNSDSTPQESKSVNNDKGIAPGMFRINPSKTSREEKHVPNTVRASARTKPITVSKPPIFARQDVNSNLNSLSSTGVDNIKTR